MLKFMLCVVILSVFLAAPVVLAQQPAAAKIEILEAKLGKNVQDRVLVDETTSFSKNTKAFLWFKVKDGTDETLTITWTNGKHEYKTTLVIGGSPWRTWATKTLGLAGDWKVTITDSDGNVIKELNFTVV